MLFWPGVALPTVAHDDAAVESTEGLGLLDLEVNETNAPCTADCTFGESTEPAPPPVPPKLKDGVLSGKLCWAPVVL